MTQHPVTVALMALTIYAVHDALIKYLGQTYSVIQIIFYAALFTLPMFVAWMALTRTFGHLKPANPKAVAFRSVAMALNILTAFYSFLTLPMGQAYALLFTSPLLVTALSGPVLGERVDRASWLAVAIGFVGVLVVLQPTVEGVQLGHVSALTAALVYAANSVLVRKLGNSERSVVLMFYPMVVTLAAMALILPWVYRPMTLNHLGIAAAISAMALGAGLLNILAYQLGRAVVIAPMQYSQIIWGIVFGYAFFGESPQTTTLVGAAIIIASGVFIVMRSPKPPVNPPAPV